MLVRRKPKHFQPCSLYLGQRLTVHLTRHSSNMCASECVSGVKAMWVCYSQPVVRTCLCGWSVHQVPQGLRSQACTFSEIKTLTSALLPRMPFFLCLFHTNSMPKFSHYSWGRIPLEWPFVWRFLILSVAPANLDHMWTSRFVWTLKNKLLIVSQLSDSNRNTQWYAMSN